MADKWVYMFGEKGDITKEDETVLAKNFDIQNYGFYKLGGESGYLLVGKLKDLEDAFENYFGLEIVDDYLTEYDDFDFDDGKFLESKKSACKSLKEEFDTSVVGTNKDKTKKYAYDFLKEWYDNIVVESLINEDGDYVLKVGFYDDILKKRPDVMDIVSAKLSGNSKFLQMLDNDTVCKLVVYDVNNPRKYGVYWL